MNNMKYEERVVDMLLEQKFKKNEMLDFKSAILKKIDEIDASVNKRSTSHLRVTRNNSSMSVVKAVAACAIFAFGVAASNSWASAVVSTAKGNQAVKDVTYRPKDVRKSTTVRPRTRDLEIIKTRYSK